MGLVSDAAIRRAGWSRWLGWAGVGVGECGPGGHDRAVVGAADLGRGDTRGVKRHRAGFLSSHVASSAQPAASGLLRGMPLAGTGVGRRAADGFVNRYGFRHSVMPRPPSAG
ncbi:polymorphic PE/PPE family protein [Mycobacterium xenopi 4042]|uniref:Polymorphic PE/PPE family protein n=1 Tax=Mycobacterium xenopi 4042 TaxID=1299334 RepID=X8BI14_MYCXE|nr:polymorphic PE/PPE family protein [Mycobacterium xenopi 4042]